MKFEGSAIQLVVEAPSQEARYVLIKAARRALRDALIGEEARQREDQADLAQLTALLHDPWRTITRVHTPEDVDKTVLEKVSRPTATPAGKAPSAPHTIRGAT